MHTTVGRKITIRQQMVYVIGCNFGIPMDQQPYDLFDIDKGTDKIFFIGTSFIVILLFLL